MFSFAVLHCAAGRLPLTLVGAIRHLNSEFRTSAKPSRVRNVETFSLIHQVNICLTIIIAITDKVGRFRSVHVSMESWPQNDETISVLPELLSTLPNLAGLRIYNTDSATTSQSICFAMANHRFPTVTSLSIPDELHTICPAFPNVTTLACPAIYLGSSLLRPAMIHFPRLDALVGVRLDSTQDLIASTNIRLQRSPPCSSQTPALTHDFPRLRALSIASPFRPDDKVHTNLCHFIHIVH